MKNSTIRMLVAVTIIGSEAMVVPSPVYGLLMYAAAFVLDRATAAAPSRGWRRVGSGNRLRSST